MLELALSTQFKKDLRKIQRQGKDKEKLDSIVEVLQKEEPLPKKCYDHELIGNWKSYRECHIEPDWLLIYKVQGGQVKLLRLSRTGSHSDLFKK